MKKELESFLGAVQKPSRYTGGEYGAILKDKQAVRFRFCLCFPDLYEIGMSHLGSRILYGVYNRDPDIWCERCYAPWTDMEAELRGRGLSLYALESGDPLRAFDMLGFTLQYELNYTNMLNMLDMAGIEPFAAERGEDDPLIVAGGPCVYNCEPVADFFDLIMIGEGEEISPALAHLYMDTRAAGGTKADFLKEAAKLQGVYVPSFYTPLYDEGGRFAGMDVREGAPETVVKTIIEDFDKAYFPSEGIVPSTGIVFDRAMVELFRGCARGCRFCQAGHTYRPLRAKKPETLMAQAKALVQSTGFEELSLSSLSTSDYGELGALCDGLLNWTEGAGVSLSLPSLRADSFKIDLMERVQKVRKSGLTFAPEAGTPRLRDVINKNLTEEDLLSACRIAFDGGWNNVKLYFMLGLPTETDEDLAGIADMAASVLHCWRSSNANKNRGVKITVSVSSFVPKSHTPFQWTGQCPMEELRRKQEFLKEKLKRMRNVTYNYHEAKTSYLEAVFSRGDRRLAPAIYDAWRSGCRMDSWDDCFDLGKWLAAFEKNNVDPAFYANRALDLSDKLPWAHISCGVTDEYFKREYRRAMEGKASPDCLKNCVGCGADRLLKGGKCHV